MNIYDFKVRDANLNEVSIAQYKGKVLLIVNTATKCGFTPQYKALEQLYKRYKEEGFEILDFPCNQFANQTPGSNEEIQNFCQLTYNTTFQTFAKINVNGSNADPLFKYLKKSTKGILGDKIKWNFTKFLVDKQGNVIHRFSSMTKPEDIEKSIIELLKKE